MLRALARLPSTLRHIWRKNPQLRQLQLYLLATSPLTMAQMLTKIDEHLADTWLKEETMSTAEMLIAGGRAEGEARGETAAQRAIVRRMAEQGVSTQQISTMTGLPTETVREPQRPVPQQS